jgi:predicted nucleotidyltransferase
MVLSKENRPTTIASKWLEELRMLRQKSSNSVKTISIDRDELLTRLRDIARRIYADRPEVAEVRVFGSIARGDQVGTSDVDVLIVLRNCLMENEIEQVRSFYPYFDLPIGVDLLIHTRDRLVRRLQAGDVFVKRMWQESLVL